MRPDSLHEDLCIAYLLTKGREELGAMQDCDPALEAALLLCHVIEKPRSHLYAWPEREVSEQQAEHYHTLLQRRLKGEPIAYLTGKREFWSLELHVTPACLIPRPETELLVEQALHHIHDKPKARIADLGTGSGAIALAVAQSRVDCQVVATDQSAEALKIARGNAERLQIHNVEFHLGNWFEALPDDSRFDLILSNPPYVAENDPHLLQGDLPFEPSSALISGPDGLDALRLICAQAPGYLQPGGWLVVEHGFDQAQAVRELMRQAGLEQICSLRDLAGHERVTEGRGRLA